MTQRPEDPEAVTNDVSGEATNVVQAGTIQGGVHIGARSNDDISILLVYERDEVTIDRDKSLSVEISTRRPGTRRLALHAEHLPSKMWEVVPAGVSVSQGKAARAEIHLHCAGNEPPAGSYDLRLVAEDAETSHGVSWRSNMKKVIVPAKPALSAAVRLEPRVSTSGEHRATVRLKNVGNTDLEGRLVVSKTFRDDPRYLAFSQVSLGRSQSFSLKRGATVDKTLAITFPPQTFRDRDWRLPLIVEFDRADVPMIQPELPITQSGWFSDLSLRAAEAVTWLRDTLRRLRTWGRQFEQRRRGVLVAWVATALVVGSLLGLLISSLSGDAATAAGTAPAPTTSSPTLPKTVSETLPCQPGMSLVVLASLTSKDADAYSEYLAERERDRMTRLNPAPKRLYNVHISRKTDLCQDVVANSRPEYTHFLWIGPVPSSEGAEVCKQLGKPQVDDCLPIMMR